MNNDNDNYKIMSRDELIEMAWWIITIGTVAVTSYVTTWMWLG